NLETLLKTNQEDCLQKNAWPQLYRNVDVHILISGVLKFHYRKVSLTLESGRGCLVPSPEDLKTSNRWMYFLFRILRFWEQERKNAVPLFTQRCHLSLGTFSLVPNLP
ncbi:mCG144979, partial [Mus musculus]